MSGGNGGGAQRVCALILRSLVWAAGIGAVGLSLFVMAYILARGIPQLHTGMFTLEHATDSSSLIPALANTLFVLCATLAMVLPVGVGAAVYLCEYARSTSLIVSAVRIALQVLSLIPSIVYGLFGYLFFSVYLQWGYSLLAGCSTLAVMVLPVVVRAVEGALRSVPHGLREAGFALGASKAHIIFRVVLPAAWPGIASAVLLGGARIIAESAALIYTAGTVAQVARPGESGRTLAVHLWSLWSEGGADERAWAVAVVLMVVALAGSIASTALEKLMSRRNLAH